MPLMAKLPDRRADQPVQVQLEAENQKGCVSEGEVREERDSGYEDFDALNEEPVDSDMEGSIMHRPRPKKSAKPPAVPQRSDKRASRILDNVLLELKNLDGTAPTKDAEQLSIVSDPHELYLSSEEDASLLDYEDTDSLVDFAPTEDGDSKPASRASSRRSQEDTARVVSFTMFTKPQIIQINIPPPTSQKRRSMTLETLTATATGSSTSYIPTRRLQPLKLYPSSNRRLSLVSTKSNPNPLTVHQNQSVTSLPARKSSKLNLSTLVSSAKNSFLTSDPFASPTAPLDEEEIETPRTSTSMAATAIKKSLSKTMNKRKPSISKVSSVDSAGEKGQKNGLKWGRELALEESMGIKPKMITQRVETTPAAEEVKKSQERKMSSGHKRGFSIGLVKKKSVKGKANTSWLD